MREGDREFWEEVQREADSGAIVMIGAHAGLGEPEPTTWLSVETKLPPNAVPVLVWEADEQVPGCAIASYYFLTGQWAGSELRAPVSHWMPLPLPPAKEAPHG